MTDGRLAGKVVAVTGASRGIGESISVAMLEAGAHGVVITGRRTETITAAAARIGDPSRVEPLAARADTEEGAATLVDTAVARFGSCDVLVNNAATNPAYGPLMDVDVGAVRKTWDVNLLGPLLGARAVWDGWMRDHGGVICNVGSVGGRLPGEKMGAYNISKAALIYLTRHLAFELAPRVRVVGVAPGITRTRFSAVLWQDEPRAASVHPLGRIGEPADVAAATVFLCSDQASWVTGVTLDVDGGLSHASPYI